ncbi:hypothetical protein ACNOYE_29905 [Nannocystaceae bacterium ST9]
MSLPLIVIAPTVVMFVIGIVVFLRGAGYNFDLRKRKLWVRKDRRELPRP